VRKGDSLAGIETDKAVFELESPADGVFLEGFFENGADIPVLTCIGAIGEPGEDVSALRPGVVAGALPAAGVPVSPIGAETAAGVSVRPSAPSAVSESSGISPRARGRAASLGIEPPSGRGTGPGGRILERDVLGAAGQAPRLTPVARAVFGSGTPAVEGTGLGGRVRLADLAAAPSSAPVGEKTLESPVRGIRKRIADRMRQSLATTAQLTLYRRFNAERVLSYRAWIKSQSAVDNRPGSTINDLILFVLARVLARHPEMNAHFLGDRIRSFPSVHLGVAVDTPRGLMVPVVRNAESLSLPDLTVAVRNLSDACQKGNVSPDVLHGGTFTLTTLGALGIERFTPVLNPPEVGILGVGGITQTAVPDATGTGVRFIPTIHLCLTIDHQAVDGAPGARFLQDLVQGLEHLDEMGLSPEA
jgi:pyruvate dehydrogenase E2 component (dihydrolipoamide acetyltransferase)